MVIEGDGEGTGCGEAMWVLGSMYTHMLGICCYLCNSVHHWLLANQRRACWYLSVPNLFKLPSSGPWNTPTSFSALGGSKWDSVYATERAWMKSLSVPSQPTCPMTQRAVIRPWHWSTRKEHLLSAPDGNLQQGKEPRDVCPFIFNLSLENCYYNLGKKLRCIDPVEVVISGWNR